ncbi:hypothetical protein KEM56_005755 [Ascosphaera pollenicola]|uniref:Uncharacterized protein n=1 Tax=Neurospora crassa (strain ATCC 24698 / 74-OR23-1A / CBS 708.71 / DSM 1257 / FGSC 987) TaxID=367110 RepID=Q7S6R2_NEUCR|nr:hypothetical protein NCU05528 [Neurospora crassa OR74A]EAA31254.1 hypothetical protein NCU05528 [Neurospora crassa OR74A]KAI5294870.1 hypothetical protein KEM56_005755 [Ascosphaera pollenicola]|eukprot:XP_960490.1 hypothetical protein NCU05528 [Neurospora crassa OR74A]
MPANETSGHPSTTAKVDENTTTPKITPNMSYVASPKVTLTPRALEILREQILPRIQRDIKKDLAAFERQEKMRASQAEK